MCHICISILQAHNWHIELQYDHWLLVFEWDNKVCSLHICVDNLVVLTPAYSATCLTGTDTPSAPYDSLGLKDPSGTWRWMVLIDDCDYTMVNIGCPLAFND
ncbi:hypothetical protein FCV25MIE_31570 [Fagus crenata]